MFKRINLYRIYGIIVLVLAIVGFVTAISQTIKLSKWVNVLLRGDLAFLPVLIVVISIIAALVILFVNYLDFSSLFSFADVIQYEKENSSMPMNKPRFALPAKVYSVFAEVIMWICFLSTVLIFIGSFWLISIIKMAPVVALLMLTIIDFYVYIVIYSRFKAFADLLEYETSPNKNGDIVERLNLDSVGLLKNYGVFSIVISIILALISIIAFIVMVINAGVLGMPTVIISGIFLVPSFLFDFFAAVMRGFFFYDLYAIINKRQF